MKKFVFIICSVILLHGCNLIHPQNDEEKEKANEKKAISIVQNAKVQTDGGWTYENQTWLDIANDDVKDQPNIRHEWSAKWQTDSIYLVEFLDHDGWGRRWETDIEQKTVKYINGSEYLSRKYNLTSVDHSDSYSIVNATENSLIKKSDYSNNKIYYVLNAEIKNKTDKTISEAELSSSLKLIFEDKTIEAKSSEWSNGFKNFISKQSPWNPGTKMSFNLTTEGLDDIYLQYSPEYVIFQIHLKAEDPIGYTFDKDILEIDLIDEWNKLKNPRVETDNNQKSNITTTLNGNTQNNKEVNTIRQVIESYYRGLNNKTFDANEYFDSNIERYITMKNTTPDAINQYINGSYNKEWQDVSCGIENSTYNEQKTDYGYFVTFIEYGTCFRVSKQKNEKTRVETEVKFNNNRKIIFWRMARVIEKTYSD